MFVYTLFNRKTGVYQDPYLQPITKDILPKMMQRQIVLDPEYASRNFLYECDLFYMGQFFEEEGRFELLDKPEFLCTFANLEVRKDA